MPGPNISSAITIFVREGDVKLTFHIIHPKHSTASQHFYKAIGHNKN
jgi:hypothetical protein